MMDISIRPFTEEERKYSYTQAQEVMHKAGCIGHLRVDMDTNGTGFFSSWDDHNRNLKTQDFKDQFDAVINELRFEEKYDGILKNRSSLAKYCRSHEDGAFKNDCEYGFRADTEEYSYLLRLNPNPGEYAAYIYAYDRELLDGALLPTPEVITVLMVEPEKPPYVKAIRDELKDLQREVGGDIQAVYPYADPVALIMDEEGKLSGKPYNRALRDEHGHIYDVIAGTFFVAGLGEENFASLSDDLIQKYKEVFKTPEAFLSVNGKLMVIPMKEEKRPSLKERLSYPPEQEKAHSPKPQKHNREER